mmetsp:Transcript_35179/g.98801  ORF Transcript_35179/g.98801 Transcript_35179/m.98801 type:complete len:220 (-) Transcript_35179:627-1286(-)
MVLEVLGDHCIRQVTFFPVHDDAFVILLIREYRINDDRPELGSAGHVLHDQLGHFGRLERNDGHSLRLHLRHERLAAHLAGPLMAHLPDHRADHRAAHLLAGTLVAHADARGEGRGSHAEALRQLSLEVLADRRLWQVRIPRPVHDDGRWVGFVRGHVHSALPDLEVPRRVLQEDLCYLGRGEGHVGHLLLPVLLDAHERARGRLREEVLERRGDLVLP